MPSSFLCSSLLLVYSPSDNPKWFYDSLSSVIAQPFIPEDIVIVLNSAILTPSQQSLLLPLQHHVNFVTLDSFHDFSTALNSGLNHCRFDIIFRFDPDDLIINNRFKVQYDFMSHNPHVDICGSSAYLFFRDVNLTEFKSVPTSHSQIAKTIYLNPLIHPSVCFRKSRLYLVGFYRQLPRSQDYDLWLRSLGHNLCFANISFPLIMYRMPEQNSKKNFHSSLTQARVLYTNVRKFSFPCWWLIFCVAFILKPFLPFSLWRKIKNQISSLLL